MRTSVLSALLLALSGCGVAHRPTLAPRRGIWFGESVDITATTGYLTVLVSGERIVTRIHVIEADDPALYSRTVYCSESLQMTAPGVWGNSKMSELGMELHWDGTELSAWNTAEEGGQLAATYHPCDADYCGRLEALYETGLGQRCADVF